MFCPQCIYVFCVDLRMNSIISLYSIKLIGFCNWDGVCLLRGTDWIFIYSSTFCPHSVFMCFVWIWEQTAIISLYSINWLVCITETESVYCVVRTGSLYVIDISLGFQGFINQAYSRNPESLIGRLSFSPSLSLSLSLCYMTFVRLVARFL